MSPCRSRPGGLEDFLRGRARRRRSVLQEERRFARAGLRVERTTLKESWERCAPLLGALQDKYGHGQPESYWRDLLMSMAETLPGSVVYLASDDDCPVAVVLAYPSGGGVTVRAAGFDYSRIPKKSAAYANLAVHRMVRHAAEHGLDAVHLGTGGYPAKIQRGGRVELLFVLAGEDAGIDPAAARSHNERVLQRLREEFGSHQEPLDAAGDVYARSTRNVQSWHLDPSWILVSAPRAAQVLQFRRPGGRKLTITTTGKTGSAVRGQNRPQAGWNYPATDRRVPAWQLAIYSVNGSVTTTFKVT